MSHLPTAAATATAATITATSTAGGAAVVLVDLEQVKSAEKEVSLISISDSLTNMIRP